ncbi:MAG: putative transcriptional regulator [Candidatus Bathyarchaeota archaeon B26-2]|mgnify:CR=1 FL=1|nr:MAG: putative transcriptional regulator [Candidatus Bathyarchaeota archaeon B26-2]
MSRKRSRLEIYLDILHVLKKGENKPTRIMYRTNLSWTPLQKILNSMVSQGLIVKRENKSKKIYLITEKGLNVLRYFDKIKEMITIEP